MKAVVLIRQGDYEEKDSVSQMCKHNYETVVSVGNIGGFSQYENHLWEFLLTDSLCY